MPTYDYRCDHCDKLVEIVKSFTEAERDEVHDCGHQMNRYFSLPWLNTSNCIIEPQKNWAFGKAFTTKTQLNEEIKRYQGETGRKLVEVGNDSMSGVKKQFKSYED